MNPLLKDLDDLMKYDLQEILKINSYIIQLDLICFEYDSKRLVI